MREVEDALVASSVSEPAVLQTKAQGRRQHSRVGGHAMRPPDLATALAEDRTSFDKALPLRIPGYEPPPEITTLAPSLAERTRREREQAKKQRRRGKRGAEKRSDDEGRAAKQRTAKSKKRSSKRTPPSPVNRKKNGRKSSKRKSASADAAKKFDNDRLRRVLDSLPVPPPQPRILEDDDENELTMVRRVDHGAPALTPFPSPSLTDMRVQALGLGQPPQLAPPLSNVPMLPNGPFYPDGGPVEMTPNPILIHTGEFEIMPPPPPVPADALQAHLLHGDPMHDPILDAPIVDVDYDAPIDQHDDTPRIVLNNSDLHEAFSVVATPTPVPPMRGIEAEAARFKRRPSGVTIATICTLIAGGGGIALGLSIAMGDVPVTSVAEQAVVPEQPAAPAEPAAEPDEPPTPGAATPGATASAPSEIAPGAAAPMAPEPVVDHLSVARQALADADAETAENALAAAREAAADAPTLRRLTARLAVLRGEGAAAVDEIRPLAEQYEDPELYVALGRLLAQAERDDAAERAFERALALSGEAVHAHIGIARLRARAANVGGARQRLRRARIAAQAAPESDPVVEARLHVAAGYINFELGRMDSAESDARRALGLDDKSAEAALLLGRIALEQRGSAADRHLRAAVEGRAPDPEALGLLAPRVRGSEACALADRYLEAAPRGYDARTVRRVERRCP